MVFKLGWLVKKNLKLEILWLSAGCKSATHLSLCIHFGKMESNSALS